MSSRLTLLRPIVILGTAALITSCDAASEEYLVSDPQEYSQVVESAKPGDVIRLANGTWENFEILFEGKGRKDKPITLTAETKGQVILSGQSNLRMAGEYLEVSGLVFRDGYTPTSEVIAFRNSKKLANYSRVTEVVIDNYNNPERYETDFWVMMYGKNNRFDHNHLVGKRNKGVTMAVRMNTEGSQENYHRIDHNYFGPRPILGSNGGETLRIGTSHHSRKNSHTTVENNYFDRADGELEIISSKSGKNKILNNTFFESRGTLTMRHGNDTLVEGNVFFGNDVDHTGGVRVINARQTVRNNYMEGLKGTRFGGAFVVMNGVPNGPINRYDPVIGSTMENNSLINSDNLQLGAGSDEERSGPPSDSTFSNNLIYNDDGRDVFTVYDDMSGIDFEDNILGSMDPPEFTDGFTREALKMTRAENGLMYPQSDISAGASRELAVTTKDMTGVSWYPKTEPIVPFQSGKTIRVNSDEGALLSAIQSAEAGDVLALSPGDYVIGKFLKLDKPLTVMAEGDVNLSFERSTLFEILDGGSLQLIGLDISGKDAPDYKGNSVIRTSPYAMLQNYRLEVIDSNFEDLDINQSFNVIAAAKGTFADNILIKDSTFETVSGAILKLDTENDDYGIYNAEYLTIENSTFKDVEGALVDYYRGGRDESTFGPHFNMTDSTLRNVGNGPRNKSKASIHLHGVQVTNISKSTFEKSAPFLVTHTVSEPKTKIFNNTFIETASPRVIELNSGLPPTAMITDNEGLNP
ncbi:polysaccharide lyase 6 family protein [Hellea balneolensis]|uniref:polysaccharide lyase 6 family protein n=1 Tax=Hellea balneolensis TaxID=287478 RepID=UPI0003FC4732|nr:polysaccharide lyase 6 family protein [Hellea balneolensis]